MSRDIYAYWEGPMPPLVTACLESWKKYAPGWNIHLLSPSNIHEYKLSLPLVYDQLPPQMRSDCIRLELLYQRGGLWMDCSIMLRKDLWWLIDFCEKRKVPNFTAFYFLGRMENWFMYVPKPKDVGIGIYRDEFFKASRG